MHLKAEVKNDPSFREVFESPLWGTNPGPHYFLDDEIGNRAIGVVYNPNKEKFGNYVPSLLKARYDAFVFLDQTKALHGLHLVPDGYQMPETRPFGV